MQHYNIGIFGLVDNGKSTFVKSLTNKDSDKHSLERQKGMTIKLNYSSFCIKQDELGTDYNNADMIFHIVDTPGHEILFTKMLTSINLIDLPILVVSPYSKDVSLERVSKFLNLLSNFQRIIVVISKLDLVDKIELLEFVEKLELYLKKFKINYDLIPFSKFWNGYQKLLISKLKTNIKKTKLENAETKYLVFKSFNINIPKTKILNFVPGIIGGVLKSGFLKKGSDVYLNYLNISNEFKSIKTQINKIIQNEKEIEELNNSGFSTIQTTLDPNLCSNDKLSEIILSSSPLEKISKLQIELIKDLQPTILLAEQIIICVLHLRLKGRILKNKKILSILLNNPAPKIIKGENVKICCKNNDQWIVKIIGKIL